MTLTVRSATVNGATTKGSALSHAEMDANWAHVIESSNQNFTQSGTGATSRTAAAKFQEHPSIEDYSSAGGVSDQIDKALTANAGKTVIARSAAYVCDAPIDIDDQVMLLGMGINSTVFSRGFSGASASQGIFNIKPAAAGTVIQGATLRSLTGQTGGCLISGVAVLGSAPDGCVFRDLWLTTTGTDTHDYTLYFDGTARTAAPIGIRDTHFDNVYIFGAAQKAALFKGMVGVGMVGGGSFTAGGTSGVMEFTGDANVNSSVIDVSSPAGSFTIDSFVVAPTVIKVGSRHLVLPSSSETVYQIGGAGTANSFLGYSKDGSVTVVTFAGAPMSGFACPDGDTFTFVPTNGSCMFSVHDGGAGKAGLFFGANASATITIISDPSSYFENSATPTAGKIGVFKSAGSNTISVINSVGSQRTLYVMSFGTVGTTTDPT